MRQHTINLMLVPTNFDYPLEHWGNHAYVAEKTKQKCLQHTWLIVFSMYSKIIQEEFATA